MSVADRVFESVRSDIITGKFPRNQLFSIYQLADRYQVSRTPVREAVLRLSNLGLVIIEKNHGVRVKELTVHDIREIYETRLLIEVPAAFYAASSNSPGAHMLLQEAMKRLEIATKKGDLSAFYEADRELHSVIISWNGNNRAAKIINYIRDESHSLGASTFQDGRPLKEAFKDHVEIYEAIINGKAHLAAQLMKFQLENSARMLIKKLTLAEKVKVENNGVSVDSNGTGINDAAVSGKDNAINISPIIFIDF